MRELRVELGARSYPIYIAADLLQQGELLRRHVRGRQVLIVSNETVVPLFLSTVQAHFDDYAVSTLCLPDGEEYKDLEHLNSIFDQLLIDKHNRTTTLIALGGGVVGDMTGFAAACYQRGVDFIQLPTTLLAQVDSSVGGKTAVNHTLGKNMLGAFYQPRCVIADTATLMTLPGREFAAGLAEVIKYGVIADVEFFSWLEANMAALVARDQAALVHAIHRSCAVKAAIVAEDEREQGRRALLNLGHTFGHAIETCMAYQGVLHGEAVAMGTALAADLAHRMGCLSAVEKHRITALLVAAGLPVEAPQQLDLEQIRATMQVDKKVLDGCLRLVLPVAPGRAIVTEDFDAQLLHETLAAAFAVPRQQGVS
ncbi:MAG: 3-dehydroquinate synthase [Pseudomonadales bacterium]